MSQNGTIAADYSVDHHTTDALIRPAEERARFHLLRPLRPAPYRPHYSAWLSAICVYVAYVVMVGTASFTSITSMASIWANSASYAHGPVALIIAVALIVRTSSNLQAEPKPWPAALLGVASASLILAIGRLLEAQILEHIAFVGLLVTGAALIFGEERAKAWAGGLAFAFFSVPFGDSLIPLLQNFTAMITEALLVLSGINFSISNNIITTETASFHIAPGCAGLGGLLMSLMVGALFSLTAFSSWRQHSLMFAAAVVLAMIANGLRVFAIIAVAQALGGDWHGLHDHAYMGWIFNGAAIAILVLIGAHLTKQPSLD